MSHRYLKSDRLLHRSQFNEMRLKGSHLVGKYVILHYLCKDSSSSKFGVTVTKKFGKAHDRNRFKRISREAYRHIKDEVPNNLYLNLRPRFFAKKAKMQDILDEIKSLSTKCYDNVKQESSSSDRSSSSQ